MIDGVTNTTLSRLLSCTSMPLLVLSLTFSLQSRATASRFFKETILVLFSRNPTKVDYGSTMTISSFDDGGPFKGRSDLTSLGKTRRKGVQNSKGGNLNGEETTKKETIGSVNVVAVSDPRLPIDFSPLSSRQTNDSLTSGMGPSKKMGHSSDQTPKRNEVPNSFSPIPEDSFIANEVSDKLLPKEACVNLKPKDYSTQVNLITERIRFEIMLDSVEEADIRTKALVIIGKIANLDPSRKIIAYHDDDEDTYPTLENAHDLPASIDEMCKYISAPMFHTKAKKIIFHTRFRSVISLLEMKRDQSFMEWLKMNKIYTSVMNLKTTENTRAGFFLGKAPHLTNVAKFGQWVKQRVLARATSCPDFQVNIEVIGRFKDPATKSKAIVIICSRADVDYLKEALDSVFHSKSNFPFTPFRVLYTLDVKTQNALYKTHKNRIQGPDIMEIGIPDFSELDIPAAANQKTLRDMCFDLRNTQGQNVFIDVDNATRTGDTVFHVRREDKIEATRAIESWIKRNFSKQVKWDDDQQFDAKTYRLDPKSRSLASQLTVFAFENTKPPQSEGPQGNALQKQVKKSNLPNNAWIDLSRVKAPPESPVIKPPVKISVEDDATVTTMSDSTWFTSKQEATEKFRKIGNNIRNLSYRHKKLEAGQECIETEVVVRMNQLFRGFELHHNRLERLEAARERHTAIQIQHIQLTLDPVAAKNNGTLAKLEKLVNKEIQCAEEDRKALDEESRNPIDAPQDADIEFLERQAFAKRLYAHFHQKLEKRNDNDDDSFNLDNISVTSLEDDESDQNLNKQDSTHKEEESGDNDDKNETELTDSETNEKKVNDRDNSITKDTPDSSQKIATSPAKPSPSWASDDEMDCHSPSETLSDKHQNQWTTTPSRSARGIARQAAATNPVKRLVVAKLSARKLFQRAVSRIEKVAQNQTNRFQALEEDYNKQEAADGSTSQGNDLARQESDMSQGSEYTDNEESEDESLDEMSLVSASEIQGLEDDLREYDDDGYDTETTDNTSPSHKRQKSSRKSSTRAQERISELYASVSLSGNMREGPKATESNLYTQDPLSPHPSLDTPNNSGGHGALGT